jgi:hypothetical protein
MWTVRRRRTLAWEGLRCENWVQLAPSVTGCNFKFKLVFVGVNEQVWWAWGPQFVRKAEYACLDSFTVAVCRLHLVCVGFTLKWDESKAKPPFGGHTVSHCHSV